MRLFHILPRLGVVLGLFGLLAGPVGLFGQETAFSYQGCLNSGSGPANGYYNFSFGLYSTNANGVPIGGIITNYDVTVSNGLFTTVLDFGPIFNGTAYWLEIGVEDISSTNDFTILSPRQALNSIPYAVYAVNAGALVGVLAATNLPSSVVLLNSSPNFSGTITSPAFIGNGSGLTNLNASQLTGGAVPNALLGTNVALLNGNNVWIGFNNFTNGLSVGSNFISTYNGAVCSWQLMQRSYIASLPVPAFRPTRLNSVLALDQMPNGKPIDSGYGVTWLDICSVDCQNTNPNPLPTLHLSSHTNFQEISSVSYNGGAALPLLFGSGSGPVSGNAFIFGITNNVLVVFTNLEILNNQNGSVIVSMLNTDSGPSACVLSELQISPVTNSGLKTLVLGQGYTANGALMPGAAVIDSATDLTNGINFVTESPAPIRFYTGGNTSTNLSMLLDQNGRLSLSNCTSFYGGMASYATNIVTAASSSGFTNTMGINMVANISGAAGTYIFYDRSGAGGSTLCGFPLFTNTVTPFGTVVPLPVNCGVAIVNGTNVAIQVYAQ